MGARKLIRGAVVTCILVLAAGLVNFAPSLFVNNTYDFTSLDEVHFLNSLPKHKVTYVAFSLGDGTQCQLHYERDKNDIVRLVRSLEKLRYTSNSARVNLTSFISVGTDERHLSLWGDFDPARAPVISPHTRSDDLAQIVQDIVTRQRAQGRATYYHRR